MKIRNHSFYLRLLEHHFRNMDCIRIDSFPSRKLSAMFGIPGENILLDDLDILWHRLQRKKKQNSNDNPYSGDQSESREEFSFDGFVTERLHAKHCSQPSSKPCTDKQIFFWDPSFLCGSLIFIHSSDDERDEIDKYEISDNEFSPCHFSFIYHVNIGFPERPRFSLL